MTNRTPAARVANLAADLEFEVTYLRKQIDKFVEKLVKDPAYTLSWSKDTFDQAARLSVAQSALHFIHQSEEKGIEPDLVLTTMRQWATETAMRMGRDHAQSTSAVSNVMENCVRVAWFEFVEKLRD